MTRFLLISLALAASVCASQASAADRPLRLAQSQTQTYNACLSSCDTQVGTCEGGCLATESAAVNAAAAAISQTGPVPLPGPRNGCMVRCSATQQVCKQSCSAIPQ